MHRDRALACAVGPAAPLQGNVAKRPGIDHVYQRKTRNALYVLSQQGLFNKPPACHFAPYPNLPLELDIDFGFFLRWLSKLLQTRGTFKFRPAT